jgi:NitT/TauT family transport system substrate-binding protein
MTLAASRRAVLAGLLAAPAIRPAAAQGAPLRFTLDWTFQGPNAVFLHANRAGYYRAEGLNVTVDAGQGSAGAIQRIVGGAYDMGFADLNSAIEYNANNPGAMIKGVMVLFDAAPFSILTLKHKGIAAPKDLEGKTLGAPQFDASFRLFPAFCAATGVDRSKVRVQAMAPPLRETMLVRGEVDFITGHFYTSILELQARGVPSNDIVVFLYARLGLPFYGNGILASPRMLAERGDQVRGFLRATVRAMRDIVADPARAITALKATDPLVDEAIETERLRMALADNVLTQRVRRDGWGGAEPDRLAASIEQVSAALNLPRRIAPSDLFDGSFLPPAAERMLT